MIDFKARVLDARRASQKRKRAGLERSPVYDLLGDCGRYEGVRRILNRNPPGLVADNSSAYSPHHGEVNRRWAQSRLGRSGRLQAAAARSTIGTAAMALDLAEVPSGQPRSARPAEAAGGGPPRHGDRSGPLPALPILWPQAKRGMRRFPLPPSERVRRQGGHRRHRRPERFWTVPERREVRTPDMGRGVSSMARRPAHLLGRSIRPSAAARRSARLKRASSSAPQSAMRVTPRPRRPRELGIRPPSAPSSSCSRFGPR